MILLKQEQDIDYGLMEHADIEEMMNLLATVFSSFDPPAVAAGLSFDEVHKLVKHYAQRAPSEALTVIARSQPSARLIGAMLTDDFASPPPEDLDNLAGNFEPVAALLEELDEQYRKIHRVEPGKFLHLFMLGVAPDFGGRGIARTLVQLTLENGRHKGYERAITEATGNVSQHIFRHQGFVERFRIPYREFIHNGKHVFDTIVDHEAVILLERNLIV